MTGRGVSGLLWVLSVTGVVLVSGSLWAIRGPLVGVLPLAGAAVLWVGLEIWVPTLVAGWRSRR